MTTEPNETETMTDSQKEDEKKVRKWDFVNKQWAATIIFSGVVLLLVAFLFIKREIFTGLLAYVFDVLRPITIGLAIAFVLYRPTCQIDKLFRKVQKCEYPDGTAAAVPSGYFSVILRPLTALPSTSHSFPQSSGVSPAPAQYRLI